MTPEAQQRLLESCDRALARLAGAPDPNHALEAAIRSLRAKVAPSPPDDDGVPFAKPS